MSAFVIAEAGVNHNGDEAMALELVRAAHRAGADAVKFQTFRADELVSPGVEKAEYQKRESGAGDQHLMLKGLELPDEALRRLYLHADELGIEFMSTPFDEASAAFLLELGMKRIKIPSGEITNEPFLEYLAEQGVPMILSTGMASINEVVRAIQVISLARTRAGLKQPLAHVLTVLHCTSSYPTELNDVNLRAMLTIADTTGLPIGYSDHTRGLTVSIAAVAMGATVIEKHFTLDRRLPGPDHQASLTPDELQQLVLQIREVESALGTPVKQPCASELDVRALVRRSVTLVTPLAAGSVVERRDLRVLRPGTGIPPAELSSVVGRRVQRDIAAGTTLQWSDLS